MVESTIYSAALARITERSHAITELLSRWVASDTRTGQQNGLNDMIRSLESHFKGLADQISFRALDAVDVAGGDRRTTAMPLGQALIISKRPEARLKVLLCGHMDAVLAPDAGIYPAGSLADGKLWGSGALDGKGGLAVLLAAVEGFEASSVADGIGWEVVVVPDEEIGSPGSEGILKEAAAQCRIGLLFEPALPDGALVGNRFGSGNFVLTVHGQAAHAGRDPGAGSNAIQALAEFIVALKKMDQEDALIHINTGSVEGGGPVNVVPDFALCRFNIRAATAQAIETTQKKLTDLIDGINATKGISVELSGQFRRQPKPLDDPTRHILTSLADCGRELGLDIRWRETAGVCDGNTLAAAGLANVDTLGPVGDGMHTPKEYVLVDSIVERARLTALYLMKVASGEIALP